MRILALDHRIQIAQPLAHFASDLGASDIVEDRLVVLVDQHHGTLATLFGSETNQLAEASGNRGMPATHAKSPLVIRE
ncbi:hypothetical protein D3C78_1597760 [compost metagenome]